MLCLLQSYKKLRTKAYESFFNEYMKALILIKPILIRAIICHRKKTSFAVRQELLVFEVAPEITVPDHEDPHKKAIISI
jgi:hypothetical protein